MSLLSVLQFMIKKAAQDNEEEVVVKDCCLFQVFGIWDNTGHDVKCTVFKNTNRSM